MMDEEEETFARDDQTPKLEEQARLNGWKAGIFDFGKAEQPGLVDHFNPGLVRRPDGLWLLVRRSEVVDGMPYGRNAIWACKLKQDRKTPEGGPLLVFPDSKPDEQFEDPRAVYWNGQVWIGCVNFTWFMDMTWTGAHQVLGVFRDDSDWTAIARRDPPVETNRGEPGYTNGHHQKNWLWFFHDGKLHLLYHSQPWKVIEFGDTWEKQTPYTDEGVKWNYGQVRGGTPPIQVGDLYWTFFHSSMPWRGRFRRYYMGALAFEAKPPFKPVLITPEPLLTGSQNDPWQQRKPLVVFPCGAVFENDTWFITYGINDLKAGYAEIPHEDVVKLAQPKPAPPASLLLHETTPRPVYAPIAYDLKGGDATCTAESTDGPILRKAVPNAPEVTLQGSAAPTSEPEGAANPDRVEKMRAAAARARATLAEMRRQGIPIRTRRKRKIKRRKRKQIETAP